MEKYLIGGAAAVAAVMILMALRNAPPADLAARASRIEGKLDLILGKLGIEYKDDLEQRVSRLLDAGNKIEAIRIYRAATGADLKVAMDAVNEIARNRFEPRGQQVGQGRPDVEPPTGSA